MLHSKYGKLTINIGDLSFDFLDEPNDFELMCNEDDIESELKMIKVDKRKRGGVDYGLKITINNTISRTFPLTGKQLEKLICTPNKK